MLGVGHLGTGRCGEEVGAQGATEMRGTLRGRVVVVVPCSLGSFPCSLPGSQRGAGAFAARTLLVRAAR